VAAAVLVVIILGWRWRGAKPAAAKPPMTERALTHNPPENRTFGSALSADGKMIAFADTRGLHLQIIDTGEVHDVALPAEISAMVWELALFPDGQRLLLTTYSPETGFAVWSGSIFGGAFRKLWAESYAATVSPQGSTIAHVGGEGHEIWLSGPNGEQPRKILQDASQRYSSLAWSPAGDRLAYIKGTSKDGTLETIPLGGGAPRRVITDARMAIGDPNIDALVWLRDGRLAFNLQQPDGSGGLYQMRVDPADGSTIGPLTLLADSPDGYTLWVSASADDSHLVVSKSRGWMDIYAVDLLQKGGPSVERMTLTRNINMVTGWTHDGKSILLHSNRTGRYQVFRQQLGQDDAEPVIQGPDDEQYPELSPDGKWILYWSSTNGGSAPPSTKRLLRYPIAGGAPEEVLETPNDDAIAFECLFAAAAGCILARPENGALTFYQLDPLHGLGRQIAAPGKIPASFWSLSPDGSLLATTTRKDRGRVFLTNVADVVAPPIRAKPDPDRRSGQPHPRARRINVATTLESA
jgi:Tol biopolymer transport system component